MIKWARLRANENVSEVYGSKDYDPVNFEVIWTRLECSCFTTTYSGPERKSRSSTHMECWIELKIGVGWSFGYLKVP